MTRQLIVTTAEVPVILAAIQSGGHVWLVRKGGHYHYLGITGRPCFDARCPEYVGDIAGRVPPVEFVQACALCRTCAGQTRYEGDGWQCPDCRIELVGPCPTCDPDPYPCRRCKGTYAVTLGHAYAVGWPLPIHGPDESEPKVGLHVLRPLVAWVDGTEQQFTTAEVTYIADDPEQPEEFVTDRLAHYGPPESLVGKWALELAVQ